MDYVNLLMGFVAGFIVAWFVFRSKTVTEDPIAKRQRLVMEYLKRNREITNNEYQELTGVSDAQATRDLDKLEKQGIVEQIGDTGRGVRYKLK